MSLVCCDRRVAQTFIVRANVEDADSKSLFLVEGRECTGEHLSAGWYRDGMWIFRLSSTRGGVSVVTQELTLCVSKAAAASEPVWHSLHGGGAPLIVLSCVLGEEPPCRMYQDGYPEGMWSDQ